MTVVCNGLPVLQHSEKTRKWFGKSMNLPSCFRVGVGKRGETRKSDTVQCRFNSWIASRVDAITVNVTKNKERVESCMGKAADVFIAELM